MEDAVIIGAGVVGAAIARCLSKYQLSVTVLEACNDVACGASKANSGIVHAGHDAIPGTLKARLNVSGNTMFDRLSQELDFPFRRCGAMVLAFEADDLQGLERLRSRGSENGVKGLTILDGAAVRRREPYVSEKVAGALYAPSSGIVGPYEMTIALAENAADNGVRFCFEKEVVSIVKEQGTFRLTCRDGFCIEAKLVVNCAGIYGDEINNLICKQQLTLINRKGEYHLYDQTAGHHARHTLFQMPGAMGKGVLVTPTTHGNLLIGPTALDTTEKQDTATTHNALDQVFRNAQRTIPTLSKADIITQFAGLRAHRPEDDFLIEESEVSGFFNVCGIDSPGLTAAPAIGEMVAEMAVRKLRASSKADFVAERRGILQFSAMTDRERKQLIQRNPLYGNIICRCEAVTEGEIVDAIRRPVGAKDLDGVKRRTRAGMGRCQSGFCGPKVLKILARERQLELQEITKCGGDSQILVAKNKEACP